jgi:plasmid stabilization system protein ParE
VLEVILLARAESDALKIDARYEERAAGRGEEFSAEVDRAIELLRRIPRLGPVFEAPFHRMKLRSFPYALLYAVEGRRLIIHTIASIHEPRESLRRRLAS